MILDRLGEDINIKDLTFEQPRGKSQLPSEISDDDLGMLIRELERRSGRFMPLPPRFHLAYKMRLLAPDRFQFQPPEYDYKKIKETLDNLTGGSVILDEVFNLLVATKEFYPEEPSVNDLILRYWGWMGTKSNENKIPNPALYSYERRQMLIMRPDFKQVDLDSPDRLMQRYEVHYSREFFYSAVNCLASLRILYPKVYQNVPIENSLLEGAKKYFTTIVKGNADSFTQMALDLKIITAEEVDITGQGLQIITQKEPPEDFKNYALLPVRRAF